jgi:VanZ family protein
MKKRYQRWILVLIWALVIFLFSCQNGNSSGNNNRFVIEFLNKLGIDLNMILNGHGDFIVRKIAHLTEFFILYYLVFNALSVDLPFKKNMAVSLFIVFMYACTDETHQIFVSGRGPSFRDVLIDTGGGALCMIIKALRFSSKKQH